MPIFRPQPVPLVADVVGIFIVALLVCEVIVRLTVTGISLLAGATEFGAGAAIVSGLLAYALIWPGFKWLWQVRSPPSWYWNMVNTDGFDIVVGAFLATAGGMLALWWQERHREEQRQCVQHLGALGASLQRSPR